MTLVSTATVSDGVQVMNLIEYLQVILITKIIMIGERIFRWLTAKNGMHQNA